MHITDLQFMGYIFQFSTFHRETHMIAKAKGKVEKGDVTVKISYNISLNPFKIKRRYAEDAISFNEGTFFTINDETSAPIAKFIEAHFQPEKLIKHFCAYSVNNLNKMFIKKEQEIKAIKKQMSTEAKYLDNQEIHIHCLLDEDKRIYSGIMADFPTKYLNETVKENLKHYSTLHNRKKDIYFICFIGDLHIIYAVQNGQEIEIPEWLQTRYNNK